MANLAGKQKLILLHLTNCSCCTFFLPASSVIHFSSRSQSRTGDALKPIRGDGKKMARIRVVEITLQSTFVHIYQSFQTFNITAPEYTKYCYGERTNIFFPPCGFSSVVFPPLPFRLPFLMFTSHHTSERCV